MELFLLVLRNLLARPVRSLLTLLGVLVATASMVLFLSFGEGLRRALFQELSRVGPAIQVVPEGAEGFVFGALPEIPPETPKALEEAGRALGARAVVPTLFLTRGGLDPSTSFLFQGLPEGTPPDLLYPGLKAKEGRLTPSEKGAVVGAKVAERSGLALGSLLRLTPRLELRVEGVLEATGGLADNLIFVPLRAIQEALGTENVTAVLVALSPGQKAEAVARALEEAALAALLQGVEAAFAEAARAHRVGLALEVLGRRPAGRTATPRLLQAAERALAEVGERPQWLPGSTDASAAIERGIPALGFGVYRGGGAHTPGEWVLPSSLLEGQRALLALLRGLGVG